MVATAATYFVAAMLYLDLFSTFEPAYMATNRAYYAWYAVAILEIAIVTLISSHWKIISPKSTHLVQRMSLLTLIILGEGTMGLAKTFRSIVKAGAFAFTGSTVGNIACAILVLHLVCKCTSLVA